ncbi:polysaccharide pyruvyl transferase family protein [Ruminococcus sp.]|uniref:polysaccharide pyruvyl transferase family protein n=1 Tax=Ruminococcus sp. TaxID=41978 RepID=UPI0025D38173|nr:polysaccharide pyruvyl transferase family protein [Ruminococcus sp.]
MKNKKVGMAINYDYPDYGGMLQAYASFRKIRDLGYEPEAINIDAISSDIRKRKVLYFAKNILDLSIVKEKSRLVFKKIRKKLNHNLNANLELRSQAFERFCKSKFKTSRKYESWSSLTSGCKEYGAVVVGSDQLWLPSNIAGDYYTLSFVPSEVKKIAYATSFGVSKIAKGQEEKAKQYLRRIEWLSAREESGQKIIKKYTGRNVPLVCDPALLLTKEEWDEEVSAQSIIKDKYIFCYFMGDNPWQRAFVQKLKKKTGYKIVALLHLDQYIQTDENYVDYAPYDISPADFINLIKNAEFVCTDSFHGTVFSIIYQKEFFTFKRFSENATLSTNTRIYTLLNTMSLQHRLVEENDSVESSLSRKIHHNAVKERLDAFRASSLQYLIDALDK